MKTLSKGAQTTLLGCVMCLKGVVYLTTTRQFVSGLNDMMIFDRGGIDVSQDPLFDYQEEGARYLAQNRFALLADEMGLGKSAQVVKACDLVGARRVLVLCPGARTHWIKEFEQWSTYRRPFKAVMTSHQVVGPGESAVCSYALMGRGAHLELFDDRWDALVLDEHHRLKDPGAQWTRAVIGADGVIHRAARTWWLSGTPAPNHAGELWLLLYLTGLTKLGKSAFEQRYCVGYDNGYTWKVTGTNEARVPELKSLLNKIMLRRRKRDVGTQLPPIHFQNPTIVEPGEVDLELCFPEFFKVPEHSKEDELMQRIARERGLVESSLIAQENAGVSTKAREQLLASMADSVSTMRMYDGLQKVDPAVEMLTRELENGDLKKVVVFAVHRNVILQLRERLKKFGAVSVFGGTNPAKRDKYIADFQDPQSKRRVFIGNIAAAGTQITLTAAHHVVFVEQSWVPGDNAQAAMRCHRIGQENPVTVQTLALAGSTDEQVAKALNRKTRELARLFDV